MTVKTEVNSEADFKCTILTIWLNLVQLDNLIQVSAFACLLLQQTSFLLIWIINNSLLKQFSHDLCLLNLPHMYNQHISKIVLHHSARVILFVR